MFIVKENQAANSFKQNRQTSRRNRLQCSRKMNNSSFDVSAQQKWKKKPNKSTNTNKVPVSSSICRKKPRKNNKSTNGQASRLSNLSKSPKSSRFREHLPHNLQVESPRIENVTILKCFWQKYQNNNNSSRQVAKITAPQNDPFAKCSNRYSLTDLDAPPCRCCVVSVVSLAFLVAICPFLHGVW